MPGIPPTVMRELRWLLLQCSEFESVSHLQTIFVDSRITPFARSLPAGHTFQQNVDNVIAHLHNRYLLDGSNALVNLLVVLAERYYDAYLGTQLYALSDRINIILSDATFTDAERYMTARSFPETSNQPDQTQGLEQVIGVSNLKEISWLRKGLDAARSVCRLIVGNSGRGSGFLVSSDLLLTNNHVIPTPQIAEKTIAEFNYQYDYDGSMKLSTRYHLDPSYFHTSAILDYTLVRVKQQADRACLSSWGQVIINPRVEPVKNEHVIIIQHPGGEPKQIAMTENYVKSVSNPYIRYTTDTRPGSSGAPVFNDGWQVIAIHHRSVVDHSNASGRGQKLNEGILIGQICADAGDFWTSF